MSEIFHKNCYTTRSSGYKYRTLATNTGDKKRDTSEDNIFDRKFKELQHSISSRIDKQINDALRARDSLQDKFNKVDATIDCMVETKNIVAELRKDLTKIENTVSDLNDRVDKIDAALGSNTGSTYTTRSIISEEAFMQQPHLIRILKGRY